MRLAEFSQEEFAKILRSALKLEFPYADRGQRKFFLDGVKTTIPAAVLILFVYLKEDLPHQAKGPLVLFIRRTEDVETHKGQMAFPGGHCEPEDLGDPIATAIRENAEEVGIQRENVKVMGTLPALATPTGFLIYPVVAICSLFYEEISLQLDTTEIAEAVWVPLRVLLSPETYRSELFSVGSFQYPIDVYQVRQHRIWGATGAIVKNLLDRLHTLS